MKKLLLLLLIGLSFMTTSCEDECMDEATVVFLSTRDSQSTIVFDEDTCIEGDLNAELLRVNNGAVVTVQGSIQVDASTQLHSGAEVRSTGTSIYGGSVFFFNGGVLESDQGLVISGHALDMGSGGEVIYCSFVSIVTLDPGINLIQDCVDTVECETLSSGGVGLQEGETKLLPCDYDYENQTVKTTKDGRQYLYRKK